MFIRCLHYAIILVVLRPSCVILPRLLLLFVPIYAWENALIVNSFTDSVIFHINDLYKVQNLELVCKLFIT